MDLHALLRKQANIVDSREVTFITQAVGAVIEGVIHPKLVSVLIHLLHESHDRLVGPEEGVFLQAFPALPLFFRVTSLFDKHAPEVLRKNVRCVVTTGKHHAVE